MKPYKHRINITFACVKNIENFFPSTEFSRNETTSKSKSISTYYGPEVPNRGAASIYISRKIWLLIKGCLKTLKQTIKGAVRQKKLKNTAVVHRKT